MVNHCLGCDCPIEDGEDYCEECMHQIMDIEEGGRLMDLRNVQLHDSNITINRMVYTIYDKVAMECGPIFEAKNDEVAKREVRRIMEKVPSWGDYCLIKVALFDVVTGKILPISGVTFEIESLFGEVKFTAEEK